MIEDPSEFKSVLNVGSGAMQRQGSAGPGGDIAKQAHTRSVAAPESVDVEVQARSAETHERALMAHHLHDTEMPAKPQHARWQPIGRPHQRRRITLSAVAAAQENLSVQLGQWPAAHENPLLGDFYPSDERPNDHTSWLGVTDRRVRPGDAEVLCSRADKRASMVEDRARQVIRRGVDDRTDEERAASTR